MSGNKPDYDVTIKRRDVKGSYKIGAAWTNRAGGINLKLAPGISIHSADDVEVTLWPPKEWGDKPKGGAPSAPKAEQASFEEDQDIPF